MSGHQRPRLLCSELPGAQRPRPSSPAAPLAGPGTEPLRCDDQAGEALRAGSWAQALSPPGPSSGRPAPTAPGQRPPGRGAGAGGRTKCQQPRAFMEKARCKAALRSRSALVKFLPRTPASSLRRPDAHSGEFHRDFPSAGEPDLRPAQKAPQSPAGASHHHLPFPRVDQMPRS